MSIPTLLRTYLERMEGASFFNLLMDLILRVLSLLLFPILYAILYGINFFHPVKFGFLYRVRLGHLVSNTDFYLRRRFLGEVPKGAYIFFTYRPANETVTTLFSRVLMLVKSELLTKLASPIAVFNTKFALELPFYGNEYRERTLAPPQVSFSEEELNRGREWLREMGLKSGDWYVCIHARDNAYTLTLPGGANYIESGNYRNADIDTYELAAREVIRRGGFVIRMGSTVEKRFCLEHPRVIDYPFLCRDDFLDVFISANCRFFISTANGLVDLPQLFDVPILQVNVVPIGFSPISKNSLYIPKRILGSNGVEVKFQEQLRFFQQLPLNAIVDQTVELRKRGWIIKDNTPDEILNATREMFEFMENGFITPSQGRAILSAYYDLFDEKNIYKNNRAPCAEFFLRTLDLSKIECGVDSDA